MRELGSLDRMCIYYAKGRTCTACGGVGRAYALVPWSDQNEVNNCNECDGNGFNWHAFVVNELGKAYNKK